MKKAHKFHCQKCDSECEIYKKGKKHRVLVCPECGVLATNPGVFKSVVKRGLRAVVGEIPGASLLMEAGGLAGDILRKKQPLANESTVRAPRSANHGYKLELLKEALK